MRGPSFSYILGMEIIEYTEVPSNVQDLTGYTGGRLRIIGIHSKGVFPGGGIVYRWMAECSCGNKVVVNGQHFLYGNVQSCGCLNKERCAESKHRKNPIRDKLYRRANRVEPITFGVDDLVDRAHVDFTGRIVGKLQVLYRTKGVLYWVHNARSGNQTRHLVVHWMCRCACGVKVERSSSYLSRTAIIPACNRCSRTINRKEFRLFKPSAGAKKVQPDDA